MFAVRFKKEDAMSRFRSLLAAVALCLFAPALVLADPATYASVFGNDADPCTRDLPCRTLARALAAVDEGGSVTALDSGRYDEDSIVIKGSVTLAAAPGVRAELTAKDGGIYVNAEKGDVVALRNLFLIGQDTPHNNGIIFNGGDALHVEGCVVSGWSTKGILALGASGRLLYVKDSIFRDNGFGVAIDGPVIGSIDGARFEHNRYGLSITVSGKATVRNSVASGNSEVGYLSSAIGPTGGTELTIDDSMAVGNGTGVRAEGFSGAKGIARVSNSTLIHNDVGLRVGASGLLYTRGNNTVAGNVTDVAGALTPLPGI
jgi:nitrous oxidase accessory protein NosD